MYFEFIFIKKWSNRRNYLQFCLYPQTIFEISIFQDGDQSDRKKNLLQNELNDLVPIYEKRSSLTRYQVGRFFSKTIDEKNIANIN